MPDDNVVMMGETARGLVPLDEVAIRLHPDDDVAIAKVPLSQGTTLQWDNVQIPIQNFIGHGHKIALRAIASGEPVRRYGQIIGFAHTDIAPGQHIHSHNLSADNFEREYIFGVDVQPVEYVPEATRQTFLGYKRANGQVGTRNMIAVISSVNCSAHTCRAIAHHFTPERLAAYPNVDDVIALTHPFGCSERTGTVGYELIQRTLANMARHPNVGAYIMVGLGCESNQISMIVEDQGLPETVSLTIQDEGGIRKTTAAGIAAIETLLPVVNAIERTPQPVSELMLALECGGSDGWSGITANPLVGVVADRLVRQGGTVVLGETPEIYGAEHLLTRRAISPEVGQKLVDKIRWWEEYTRQNGVVIDNNPAVGNKAGGLTTIYEKSLGAVAKGGTTPLTGVFDYAERVTARGFTVMDTPGYDSVSVTGQVAGGSNLVLFTTGRGSVFGFKPAPSIKIATNSPMYARMEDDMDFDAGRILDSITMDDAADELWNLVLAVASGQASKSEAQDVGEAEFNPWHIGAVL